MFNFNILRKCYIFVSPIVLIMNWNELRKLAVKNGFRLIQHGKKHDEYYNEQTGKTIQIERHWSQEVRKGLMLRLKKEIGF